MRSCLMRARAFLCLWWTPGTRFSSAPQFNILHSLGTLRVYTRPVLVSEGVANAEAAF